MNNIEELQDMISKLHGSRSKHKRSVRVTETFRGQVVWDGVVEVFRLEDHPEAKYCFAWSYAPTGSNKIEHVAVLGKHPIETAADAVRAFIVKKSRGGNHP